MPSVARELTRDGDISFHVLENLRFPAFSIVNMFELFIKGCHPADTPSVSMPEVTVDEDSHSRAGKNDVGFPEQSGLNPESEPFSPERAP
ncbi:hypothetical protein RKD32_005045 [Streptomyces sp. SAI-195]